MIEVKGCSGGYGSGKVLRDISLQVESGKILSIFGPNGAGKSTLVRGVMGLLPDFDGSVVIDGKERIGTPARGMVAAGVSHVPEGRGVFARLSVLENLRLGAKSKRGDLDAALQEVFSIFGVLADRRKQVAGTLSGGEQQMLAIGRGLMARPRYLLVDEPSLGLAPKLIDDMFEHIRAIAAEREVGVLLAEQDTRLRKVADEICVMVGGAIVERGGPEILSSQEKLFALYRGESPETHPTGSPSEDGDTTTSTYDKQGVIT